MREKERENEKKRRIYEMETHVIYDWKNYLFA